MEAAFRILSAFAALALCALMQSGCGSGGGPDEGASPRPASSAEVPLGQLPDTARPLRYRLHLKIDPDADGFSGKVEIDVDLAEAADGVWLHGRDLSVNAVTVRSGDGADQPARYEQKTDSGVARVSFGSRLPAGVVTLAFDYRAPFNDSLEGLYRIAVDGKNYAATQFEATSARLAFPSFDEPRFKVPFDIALEVRDGATAVTNTPAVAEEPAGEGFTRTRYAETAPLPTYLIAFIVGPWEVRAGDPIPATPLRDHTVPLRGIARAGKGDELGYALSRTGEIVEGLEDYFGIAYPYPKLDLVAVPDFAAGAMENAGAITYREQLLLFGDDASILRRLGFASVNAHELAHQWFGDLVTPTWWNDIWLNEAFATWMAAKVMQRLEPDQGYRMRRLRASLAVMGEDALASARQIRQPIVSYSDIGSAFDGITYQKGAAMLSMLERFIGEDNFRRGVHDYLATHRYGNADAHDFVQSIAATRPDLPDGQVDKAFFSFLEQPGTPLVDLDWSCPAGGATRVTVEQSRYLPLGSKGDGNRVWLLPLCVAYGDGGERREHCRLVSDRSEAFDLPTSACAEYVMPNGDATGYYRFNLREEAWAALLSAAGLTDEERLAAAASLSGAFHAGKVTAAQYLSLVRKLLDSDDVDVVTAPLQDLKWIHDRLLTGDNQRRLNGLLADYYAGVAARVPPDARPDDRSEVQLQSAMARLYGLLIKTPTWRSELAREAIAYLDARERNDGPAEGTLLPANLRETAFAVAVEEQGPPFAERLLSLFHRADDAQLRQEILNALDRSAGEAMLARLRELALTKDVRDNEVGYILGPQMEQADSRDTAWEWLLAHFDAVAARRPYWLRGGIVSYGSEFCSEDRVRQINRQLARKVSSMGGGPRSLAETVERIELCEALVKAQEDAANGWLSGGGKT